MNQIHHKTINPRKKCTVDKMLILNTRHKYKFKKEIQKIHWFSPDNRGGVVLLGLKTLGKDAIYHYGADSKLQFQHCFDELIDSCAILDPKQVMALEVKYNRIFILNLETHQVRYYKFHYFQIEVSCQVTIETFIDTSLVCIRQNGNLNDHRLKLTYYRYPFPQGNVKDPNQVVCTFETTENYQWTTEYSIRKGNNHSMIVWYKSRQDQIFELRVFDLYQKQLNKGRVDGNFRILQIRNLFLADQIPYKPAVCLMKVWQMKEDVFMLICTTDKENQKIYNKKGNVINNFVWDADKEIIRETQVQFDPQFNPYQIEILSSGRYAMFRTFYFQNNGEVIDSPALFIRNKTQEVVAKQWGKVTSESKWRVPGYSDSIFAQGIYDNSQVSEMKLRIVKIVDRTLQSFYMLMQGDDDLDDQLLSQIISNLDYEQNPPT